MRQRVMIAMALSCKPALLIADEPTTALDVTIQAQILELMKELQQAEGTAIILITHDLGIVANICRRVNVMYAGRFVEEATVDDLFARPRHPYTLGLFNSIPRLDTDNETNADPGQPPDLIHLPSGCAFNPLSEHGRTLPKEVPPLSGRKADNDLRVSTKSDRIANIYRAARCGPCPSICAALPAQSRCRRPAGSFPEWR